MCKPNKLGKGMEKMLGHRGFGKLRGEAAAQSDERFEYRLEHDPRFLRRVKSARSILRAGRGIKLEDVE
jgi:hypothetical protein